MGFKMKNIQVDKEKIVSICKKYHIKKLAFLESVLREDFRPDSDVDVLIEFKEGHIPGFGFFTIQEELSQVLGRKVDLHTPPFLSRYFRDQVITEAQVQYAA